MKKSKMMKRYEAETWKQSAIVKFMAGGQALEQKSYPKLGPYDYGMDYIAWLEAKAEAYDRLMSGGKKTLKEWANIFGMPVAVDKNGESACFVHVPVMNLDYNEGIWTNSPKHYGEGIYLLPPYLIDFYGDWEDSLTLPDGREDLLHLAGGIL